MASRHPSAKHPSEYAVVYNWDGAPHGASPVPQSREQLLDAVFAPIRDTGVGALFWCVGEHTARWLEPGEGLETVGALHNRTYENASTWMHSENILQMLERGDDPQADIIERGHELGL